MGKDIVELRELKQADINQFAKELVKFNYDMTNMICRAEELYNHPYINSFSEYDEDHERFIKKLAKTFAKKNKNNDEVINIEMHSSYFQGIDSFMDVLNKALYELD